MVGSRIALGDSTTGAKKVRWNGCCGERFTRKADMLMARDGEIENHDGTRGETIFFSFGVLLG